MAILFISNVVPDKKPYNDNGAFTRSGNNVVVGIADNLPDDTTLVSCRPTPSFPHGPIWVNGEIIKLDSGREIRILPMINITIIKNLFWAFQIKHVISKWAKKHKAEERNVLVYNIYTPPISSIFKVCRNTGSKLFAILYDLGIPPNRLGLNKIRMMGYQHMEKVAKKFIPLLDGRIVINEKMVEHYAPGKDYILVDGGINEQVIVNLRPLQENPSKDFIFLLAGMLWDQNGTRLILDTFKEHKEINAQVYFAGMGIDVPLIKKACMADKRLHYAGMLNMADLFELYSKADVLLNLRLEEETDFHFPSKLLEYMVTGKHVLSTPNAHAERDYGEFITILHDITSDGFATSISDIIALGKHALFLKGKKARQFMLEKRNWKIQTNEILEYINRKNNGN